MCTLSSTRYLLKLSVKSLKPVGAQKRVQAIAVVSCIRESWPVLVLAPSALRLHWPSIVIADESHFLKKNQCFPSLITESSVCDIAQRNSYFIKAELFKQLEALHPTVYKNVHEYGNRFCKGGIFGVYQGASNHEELHSLIKATVMIRRLKKDVLSELPQKRRQQVFLELGEKEMRQVNALFRELEVIKGEGKLAQSEAAVKSRKFAEKSLISKIYTASAEAKIPAVLDYLGTMVEVYDLCFFDILDIQNTE
ncbi:hypothetical protein K7X08_027140 [Anisodus acutangulus]|uniref:SNF2 N-terminal domain-containing protein n=1 Tax=Anisodus acutangulus TaxID=402998 RepID=A0A9Q1MIF3_9SOLA|nr:hypothetical protein K7X08_027140 [Anisodus acutangulus]